MPPCTTCTKRFASSFAHLRASLVAACHPLPFHTPPSAGLRLPRLSSVALVKRLICRMHDRTIYPSYQRLTVGGKVLLDGYEQEGRDGPEWVERTLRSYGVDNGSVLELDFQASGMRHKASLRF